MRIRTLAASAKQPQWVEQGVREYTRRLPKQLNVEFLTVPLGRRGNDGASAARAAEGRKMLAGIRPGDFVVCLEVEGKQLSTEAFAGRLDAWIRDGRNLVFLIGGPDGLAPECVARANFSWSLSRATLPHGLVRILLAEHLYRAWTVLTNHPYHRA